MSCVRDFVDPIGGFLTGTRFFVHLTEHTVRIKCRASKTGWNDSWALIFYNFTVFLAYGHFWAAIGSL